MTRQGTTPDGGTESGNCAAGEIGETELQELFRQAILSISREIDQEYRQEKKREQEQEKERYKTKLQFIRALLERYRQAPAGSWTRETIDSLATAHRDTCGNGEWDKIDHNITVLRYLVKDPLTDKEICERLEIGMESLIRGNARTIGRMAILLYGIDGINPKFIGTGGRI